MDINRLLQSDVLSAVIKQAVLNKQTNNKISTTSDGLYELINKAMIRELISKIKTYQSSE